MTDQQKFISSIKDATIAACKGQNIVVSIAIAQACLESNFGLSGLSLNCNNFFGIKAGSHWTGKRRAYPTNEYDKTAGHMVNSFAQTIPTSQLTFSTLTDLRAQSGTSNSLATLNGLAGLNDGNGGTYMWSASSTATDDGFTIVKVGNVTTGRWLRIGNGNTIKGSVTTSGIALQTAYTVSYQTGTLPFIPITVIVNPRSQNAAVPSWISSITNSGFTINFSSIPVVGTNNIAFDYIVVKQ